MWLNVKFIFILFMYLFIDSNNLSRPFNVFDDFGFSDWQEHNFLWQPTVGKWKKLPTWGREEGANIKNTTSWGAFSAKREDVAFVMTCVGQREQQNVRPEPEEDKQKSLSSWWVHREKNYYISPQQTSPAWKFKNYLHWHLHKKKHIKAQQNNSSE